MDKRLREAEEAELLRPLRNEKKMERLALEATAASLVRTFPKPHRVARTVPDAVEISD